MIDIQSKSTNTYIPFNISEREGSISDHKSLNLFPYKLKEYVPLGALHFTWAKYSMLIDQSMNFGSPYNVHINKEGKPDFIFKSKSVEPTEENILAYHYLSMMFFQKYNFFPYTIHPNLKPNVINNGLVSTRISTRFYCKENGMITNRPNVIYTSHGYIYNNDGNCIGFLEIPYKLYIFMFYRLYSLPDHTIHELNKSHYQYDDLLKDIYYNTRVVIDERYDLEDGHNNLINYLREERHIDLTSENKDVINKVSNIFEYVTGETINIKTKKQIINV